MRRKINTVLQAMKLRLSVYMMSLALQPATGGELGFIQETEALKIVRGFQSGLAEAKIWYLRPLNEEWSRFEWNLLVGEREVRVKKALRDCVIFEDAGIFKTLDFRFEDADERGQGIIVIKNKEQLTGLMFRADYVSLKSLKIVPVVKFSETQKEVVLPVQRGFMGLLLSSDVKALLK